MKHEGPIIIIDDDRDDIDFLKQVFSELAVENEIVEFTNCNDALKYLQKAETNPFLIFCDITISGMDGIQFKSEIDKDQNLREKSVPFIFLSTSVSHATVMKIYGQLRIQGYFTKPSSLGDLKELMNCILRYWLRAELPTHL